MGSGLNSTASTGLSLPAVLGHVWSTFLKKPLGLYGLSFGGRLPLCLACMVPYEDMRFIHRLLIFAAYVFYYFVHVLIISYAFELNRRRSGTLKEAAGRIYGVAWPLLCIGLIAGLLCQGAYSVLSSPFHSCPK